MKPTLLLIFVLFACITLQAADDRRLAAVRAADDQRVAATLAADGEKLREIFSDELRYAHSSGLVDTKTSYIQSIVSGRTKSMSLSLKSAISPFPLWALRWRAGVLI